MVNLLEFIQKLSVVVFLLSSMFGAGLSLTLGGLAAPLSSVRLVLFALLLNFVFAPGLAWLLTVVIPLQREHAIATFLLAGAAGAPFLPKLAESARGDMALAVALMALLICGTIVFMPLALPVMIPGWTIARPRLLLILLPLVLGMLVKRQAASFAARLLPFLAILSNGSLLLLFVLLIALNAPALLGVVGSGAILAAILYVLGLFVGTWILSASMPQARGVLALATAARNFGAAPAPAAGALADRRTNAALIVKAVVGLIVSFIAAGWLRRRAVQLPGNSAFVVN